MNTYTYEFATGNKEIKISEEWMNVLEELDREEYNINKKETRRHLMLDLSKDGTAWTIDDIDPEETIIEIIDSRKEIDSIMLLLNEKQRELVRKVCIEGVHISEYAKSEGISRTSAIRRLQTIRKKLKKGSE